MAILRIPLPTSETPILQQRVSLDGVSFRMSFRFNARIQRWLFRLDDSDDQPIVYWRPLVSTYPLLDAVTDPRRPAGQLLLVTADGADPDLDGIDTARLYYFAED